MPTNCSAAKQLPQFCKHSKSADLLRKSLLSHVWRVPSSTALSCKHERLFDLLTLASSFYITYFFLLRINTTSRMINTAQDTTASAMTVAIGVSSPVCTPAAFVITLKVTVFVSAVPSDTQLLPSYTSLLYVTFQVYSPVALIAIDTEYGDCSVPVTFPI